MKKAIVLIFFYACGYSQTIRVDYIENRIVSKERLEKTPEFARAEVLKKKYFSLINSNGVSMYSFVSRDKVDTLKTETHEVDLDDTKQITQSIYKISSDQSEDFYYKDFADNSIIFRMFNGGTNFDGRDKLINWNWIITNETQKMNGFTCKKAISNSYGTQFIAWFTEEISISDGPQKYSGLPGLILHVSTPFYEWNANNIEIIKTITTIEKPREINKTYTFLEIRNILLKKTMPISGTITKTEGNSTTTTTTTVIRD